VEVAEAMTAPDVNGQPSLPKRSAPKGLLPSTWLERTLQLEHVDGFGAGACASGVLLDFFPAGAAHRRSKDLDLLGAPCACPARRGLGPEEPSRATRRERYDHLTIFLLQK
jgi:hypothetical protein